MNLIAREGNVLQSNRFHRGQDLQVFAILKHRTIVESELCVPIVGTIGKDNDIVITNLTTENHTVIEDSVKEVGLTPDLDGRMKLVTPKPNKMNISLYHRYMLPYRKGFVNKKIRLFLDYLSLGKSTLHS